MKNNKREKILLAAQELFSEKGFHETTVEEIAKEAGVAKGTVYIYFDSKEQIFEQVVKSGFTELTRLIEKQIENISSNPLKKIQLIIEAFINYFNTNRSLFRPLMIGEIELKSHRAQHKKHIENYVKNVRRLAEIMEEAINMGYFKPIDPIYLSLALMGIMEQLIFFAIEECQDLKPLTDITFNIFVKGALKEGVEL